MDVHQNARLTPHCRALLVDRVMRGRAKRGVAAEFGITVKTLDNGSIDIARKVRKGCRIDPLDPITVPPRPRGSWSWQS